MGNPIKSPFLIDLVGNGPEERPQEWFDATRSDLANKARTGPVPAYSELMAYLGYHEASSKGTASAHDPGARRRAAVSTSSSTSEQAQGTSAQLYAALVAHLGYDSASDASSGGPVPGAGGRWTTASGNPATSEQAQGSSASSIFFTSLW